MNYKMCVFRLNRMDVTCSVNILMWQTENDLWIKEQNEWKREKRKSKYKVTQM